MNQKTPLAVQKKILTIPHFVMGLVSRTVRKKNHIPNARHTPSHVIFRLFLLNIFLSLALVVSLVDRVLAHVKSQFATSLAITLTAAVIAIVTSWFLSIGKKLWNRFGNRQ